MDDDFDESFFAFYFNLLINLGCWVIESDNRVKKVLHLVYSSAVSGWTVGLQYLGFLDLLNVIPDINKISRNFCIFFLLNGAWIKTVITILKSKRINGLRRSLHRNIKTCKDETEILIYVNAMREVNFITKMFYILIATMFPVWLGLSLFNGCSGGREFPPPTKWPFLRDKDDSKSCVLTSLCYSLFVLFYLIEALALEVSMFGILAQIDREYRFLIKRVEEFGNVCDALFSDRGKNVEKRNILGEINIYLQKAKAKRLLKEMIARQTELFMYTKDFQYGYDICIFIQIFAGGLLVVISGIQISFEFDLRIFPQLGYVLGLVVDAYIICWWSSEISTKCFEVGTAFYATPWYKMDIDFQKDILFVMLRSQSPPRITAGKFVELNLRTFTLFLKDIYGWLTLIRKVALK